ncbi:hypothetical protein [Streptomyces scopuliridis]
MTAPPPEPPASKPADPRPTPAPGPPDVIPGQEALPLVHFQPTLESL